MAGAFMFLNDREIHKKTLLRSDTRKMQFEKSRKDVHIHYNFDNNTQQSFNFAGICLYRVMHDT